MGTPLTVEMVAQIMPNARNNGLDNEWTYLLNTLRTYEINTKNRIAAFLMNIAGESGELYYTEEIWGPTSDQEGYEGRVDLGNVFTGDGYKFRGRGYIQITGRGNTAKVGTALGIDTANDPSILSEMPYPWYSAGYYWQNMSSWGDLNEWADEGDFRSTIKGVRGAGDRNREAYWWTAMNVLPDDLVLTKSEGDVVEDPSTLNLKFDQSGWAYTPSADGSKIWVASDRDLKRSGLWVWGEEEVVEPPSSEFSWPVADTPPGYWGDGSYIDVHPTRYTFRQTDVDEVAQYLVENYDCWVNTYVDHPPGWWLDDVSIDIWGPGGRGDQVNDSGDAGFWDIFNNGVAPWIRWCIRDYYIWDDYNGWREFWEFDLASDGPHVMHRHITFY